MPTKVSEKTSKSMHFGLGPILLILGGLLLFLAVSINLQQLVLSKVSERKGNNLMLHVNIYGNDKEGLTDDGDKKSRRHSKARKEEKLPPCGEICTYSGTVSRRDTVYPQLSKQVDCSSMMKRMAWRKHDVVYPPLKSPPLDQYDEFTQNGFLPMIENDYYIGFTPDGIQETHQYTSDHIKSLMKKVKTRGNISPYEDDGCVMDLAKRYKEQFTEKEGVVIGTLNPWLEAILLANGAHQLTTLEYTPLTIQHAQIDTYTPYTFAERFLNGTASTFDFGASYSSLQHSGLGRYGDPLNPYGDFEAMAQVWCMLKPGGTFFLGVPGRLNGGAKLNWNANRYYNSTRFQHLTANWEVRETHNCPQHTAFILHRLDLPA